MDAAPSHVPRVPFDRLRAATNDFADANKIGSGATGDVFRGLLNDAPVAVKVLKLKVRSPEARAATELAFRRELNVLSAYRHARLVKILGFAVADAADAETPFALYFELLTEGSLADWLRPPNGGAPKKTRAGGAGLTALERVDIALGAAGALCFLHGHRDESAGGGAALDEGGGGAAGGAEALPPAPDKPVVLHRDVKAANIVRRIVVDDCTVVVLQAKSFRRILTPSHPLCFPTLRASRRSAARSTRSSSTAGSHRRSRATRRWTRRARRDSSAPRATRRAS